VTSYATLNNIGILESENQTYHTGITVPKSNGGKIVERGQMYSPNKQNMTAHFHGLHGAGTSIKS
jgi:hypothetical protein